MGFRIKQISVFAENRPGRLAEIAEGLEQESVNILAFSIADAGDFGVMRILADEPGKARDKLANMGYAVQTTDVLAVRMDDRPGGLRAVADQMRRAGLDIIYAYALTWRGSGALVVRVENIDEAVRALKSMDVKLVEESELK